MADTTGAELTYGQALVRSFLLARWLRARYPHEAMVGLLLPASVSAALANLAVLLAGKVPINLDPAATPETLHTALRRCDLRTVLTTRPLLHHASALEQASLICLEEVLPQFTRRQKAWTMLTAWLLPSCLLQALWQRAWQQSEALATVMFSPDHTGTPQGVMLSHHNILSNIEGLEQVFMVRTHDRIMGLLPFSQALGFTVTLWFPLVTGCGVIYHARPLEVQTLTDLVQRYRATILIGTPTFYAAYLQHCPAVSLASVRYAVTGTERLSPALAEAFKATYGLNLLEGYGCTEMAPVVSVNIRDVGQGTRRQTGYKPGTVGHPIPGVAAKVVHPDTGQVLPCGTAGLLLVQGPNLMLGYLGAPDKTAQVVRGGWYDTGDLASIDEDGFIRIIGRLSRCHPGEGNGVRYLTVIEEASRQTS
jgi:acyl-[acyl-carrier-protein]-phospholipid O-acyltransferase/long-chain-fatty-acid--[acyl-carrier-protein] ligase